MRVLSDADWEPVEPFMPTPDGKRGGRFRDHRTVVEGIIYRYRTGIAWRDLPREFGPRQTVWKRHRRFAGGGTWDHVLSLLLTRADAAEVIDWQVAVDSTITRAHQHASNTTRFTGGTYRITRICSSSLTITRLALSWGLVDQGPSALRRRRFADGGAARPGAGQRLTDVHEPA